MYVNFEYLSRYNQWSYDDRDTHVRANVKVFAMHSRTGSNNCNTQLHNAATGVEMK